MAYIAVPIDFFEKDQRMRKLTFRFGGRSAAALPIRLWCLAAQESPRDGRLAEHALFSSTRRALQAESE